VAPAAATTTPRLRIPSDTATEAIEVAPVDSVSDPPPPPLLLVLVLVLSVRPTNNGLGGTSPSLPLPSLH
jgi:hypothetical protein